jgi:regulator of RNase E activity RraA
LPPDYLAAEVLAKARAGMAKEHQVRERIQQGEYLFDMLRLGDVLKGLNVVEE